MDAIDSAAPNFLDWLSTQQDRDDPVGDIAVDLTRDRYRPKDATTLAEFVEYLTDGRLADRRVIDALQEAWTEFTVQERRAPVTPAGVSWPRPWGRRGTRPRVPRRRDRRAAGQSTAA